MWGQERCKRANRTIPMHGKPPFVLMKDPLLICKTLHCLPDRLIIVDDSAEKIPSNFLPYFIHAATWDGQLADTYLAEGGILRTRLLTWSGPSIVRSVAQLKRVRETYVANVPVKQAFDKSKAKREQITPKTECPYCKKWRKGLQEHVMIKHSV